jgi:hypothetical protein
LVVPEIESSVIMGMARNIIEDFQLEGSRLLIIFPDLETTPEEKYRRFPKRDFWIAALADRIYPVSVRPSGNLARLVELFSIIPDRVSDKFKVDYVKPAGTGFHPEKLAIFEPDFTGDWDYLTHWTRTAIDPWPGESKAEYFRSIVEGAGGYTHSGFNTLCRILRDLQIVGSDRLIRGDYRMVSFTESPPWELCKLIKWRPQLLRWTFEPYGIAIKKDKLSALGARKVVYGLDYQYRFLQGDDKAYFQAYDPEGNNWREEREWRYMGNLDLRRFNPEDVKVMVHTFDEAEKLGEWSPFPVVWWEELGNKK